MRSHPVIEAVRQYFQTVSKDWDALYGHLPTDERRAIGDRLSEEHSNYKRSVDDALQAIEPALANGEFDSVPEQLRSKAYLDWAGSPHVNDHDNRTVINDETIFIELFDRRQSFIERSLGAADEGEAESLRASYHRDLLTLLTGHNKEGMRSLGPVFDKRLLEARRAFKERLIRNRSFTGDGGSAFREYHRALVGVVLDFFDAVDKAAQEQRDRKVHVIDRTVTPAPEPTVVEPDRPRVVIESVEHVADAEHVDAAELERALTTPQPTAETIHAIGGHVEFEQRADDPYSKYNERISSAYKQQPPTTRKRKRPVA